jgi:hypothetical protein
LAEVLISAHFRLFGTRPARWIVDRIPFGLLGWVYTGVRTAWKHVAAKKFRDKGFRVQGSGLLQKHRSQVLNPDP